MVLLAAFRRDISVGSTVLAFSLALELLKNFGTTICGLGGYLLHSRFERAVAILDRLENV